MKRRFDLTPRLYEALQRFVHRDHKAFAAVVETWYEPHAPGPALELGCGTGMLSQFFRPGEYVGCDFDLGRVELARRAHPEHEFVHGDATTLEPEFIARFPFVLCHAWLHHIADEPFQRILERIAAGSRAANRTIEAIIIEPLLPASVIRNPAGYLLAKLDRGRYVRSDREMSRLFGSVPRDAHFHRGPWWWPVAGATYELHFDPHSAGTR